MRSFHAASIMKPAEQLLYVVCCCAEHMSALRAMHENAHRAALYVCPQMAHLLTASRRTGVKIA